MLRGSVFRDVAAGLTLACISLPVSVASGVVAYEPLGPHNIAKGAAAGLLCGVVAGFVGALARTSSFVVTAPQTTTALVQASFASAIVPIVNDEALALAALPLCVLAAGLWQILFGVSGLGRLVKFTPYPVLAGFVSGIAILIALQQFRTLLEIQSVFQVADLVGAGQPQRPLFPVFALCLVAVMLVLARAAPNVPTMLGGLVIGVLAYHAAGALAPGLDLGPTIGTASSQMTWTWPPLDPAAVAALAQNGLALGQLLFSSLTLAVLGTLDTFFALRAARNLADTVVAPRRDLIGQGIANVGTALVGGAAASSSTSLTTANFRAGGRSRLSRMTSAAVLGAFILFPAIVGALPVAVLAAILIMTALRLFDLWCLDLFRAAFMAREREGRVRARRNAGIVLIVTTATVLGEPVIGAGGGVVLACFLFIAEMSRPTVRVSTDASHVSSKRLRPEPLRQAVRASGHRIAVLELQGVLFFGNADDLNAAVSALGPEVDIIILDFRRVSDVDASGMTVLQQIAGRCRSRNKYVVISAADATFAAGLRSTSADGAELNFSDLDTALEWAEEKILAEHGPGTPSATLDVADMDLARGMGADEAATLRAFLDPVTFAAGTKLCRSGDPADRLWLLASGRVSIRVPGNGSGRRLAEMGAGTSIGELGFLDRSPRSAEVHAEDDVTAYVLTREAFERLSRDHPRIAQIILMNIARQTAQRLRDTTEELRIAQA